MAKTRTKTIKTNTPDAGLWLRTLALPYKIILGVVLALLIFRLFLPGIVKNYVNQKLNELSGYHGHVNDIDIHLLRGAYTIHGLLLTKHTDPAKYPFLKIDVADLSIQWGALLKGKLVGKVEIKNARVNVLAATENIATEPSRASWSKTVKALMPITVNSLLITDGRFDYLDFATKPNTDLHIKNMRLTALNLANVEKTADRFPSKVTLTGKSIGDGRLKADMNINVIKDIPDFNLNLSLTDTKLTSLNGFLQAHAKLDVAKGIINFYSELKLVNGEFKGYVKPFITGIKVLDVKKDIKKKGGIFYVAKKAIVGLFVKAVENPKTEKIATRIPIEGNVKNVKINGFQSFVGVLRNAFIKAFHQGIDGSVN